MFESPYNPHVFQSRYRGPTSTESHDINNSKLLVRILILIYACTSRFSEKLFAK